MSQREWGNIELSYEYLTKCLDNYTITDLRMLDVGTNKGSLPFLMFSRERAYMDGVDITADAIAAGKKEYKDIENRLFTIGNDLSGIKDNSYDIVTMFDVIEHIPNIDTYLRDDIVRILKPGGMFVFQTPNARINPIFETLKSKSFTQWKEWHCSLQTPESLHKLLEDAGFKEIVVEKYRIDSEYNRNKIRNYLGPLTEPTITILQHMPLALYSNLWGHARV